VFQRGGGQPAPAFGVGPALGQQPILVGGVNVNQFGEAGFGVGQGLDSPLKIIAVNAGAFEFFYHCPQRHHKAGLVTQRGVVDQAIFCRQLGHNMAQQPELYGFRQARLGLSGPGQDVGVEGVEGVQVDTQRPAVCAQPAAEGVDLGLVGQNHGDRREGEFGVGFPDTLENIRCFAVPGGGQVKMCCHQKI